MTPERIIAATEQSGIGALGINLKSFLFQLATFLIVLFLLKKFVFSKITKTLDAREELVEETSKNNLASAEALKKTETEIKSLLSEAQDKAEQIIETAKMTAQAEKAEAVLAAENEALQIKQAAHENALLQAEKLRRDIQSETAELVALATEKVLARELTKTEHSNILKRALLEVKK
jgi:F-type H+-transporting ATPase subunit b